MPTINLNTGCSSCEDNSVVVISNPCTCRLPNCETCNPTKDCGCPIKLDTSCVIYNKNGGVQSGLINISYPNGTNLKTILERIDVLLGQNNIFNFDSYDLSCIRALYPINGFGDFASAVSKEICGLKSDLDTINCSLSEQINNFNTLIDTLNHPNFSDTCGLGIGTSDTIKDILIKLKDGYCSLKNTIQSENSPSFLPINSNSVSWISGGFKGHQPTANVKVSVASGNTLQLLSDGLFVPSSTVPSNTQVLSYNPGTRIISLSGGGGSVTLPPDSDNQNLTFNCSSKVLSISGGTSADLSCLAETPNAKIDTNSIQTVLSGTNNRTISSNVKISACSGNLLTIQSDGLCATYAPSLSFATTDEKVMASSTDTNPAGYLDEKIEGGVVGALTTSAAFNTLTNKVKVTTTANIPSLLGALVADAGFCAAITACICFKFRLRNTGVSSATYSYVDCSNTSHTGLTIGPGVSIDVCGKSVDSVSTDIIFNNLGFC